MAGPPAKQAFVDSPTWKEDILSKAPSNHRLFVPSALALLLFPVSQTAFAADPDRERDVRREITVERAVKLQPEVGTEVIVPELKALFLSDGSVTLTGQGTARVNAPPQGFDFEVDLTRGTYVTRHLDQREIEKRGLQDPAREERGKSRLDPAIEAITPGTWSGRVRVLTEDPVFIDLTETMTRLTWTVSSTGAVAWQSYSDSCWAANPSSLGTHWYVSSCAYGGPYTSSGRICNNNSGSYYNYDFGFDEDITTASQTVYLCGRNDAMYDYNFTHNDGGEGALLIFGSVVTG